MGIGSALRKAVGIGGGEQAPRADSPVTTSVPPASVIDNAEFELAREADSGDAEQHARRLLEWFQSSPGAHGSILSRDVQAAYLEMCAELGGGWKPLPWQRVGAFFSRMCGPRKYVDVVHGGICSRLRAYIVPRPGEVFATDEARARHPSAPLPQRLTAIESAIERLADQIGMLVATSSTGAGLQSQSDASVINFKSRS